MSSTTRRLAAALVLPVVLLAGACGSSETPTAPGSSPAGAQTSAAPSGTAPAAGGKYADKAAFIGALKAAAGSATTAHVEMTMTSNGQDVSVTGDSRMDPADPAMQMSMDMGSQGTIEIILVDKKVYMKGVPSLPADKWTVLDSSGPVGKEMTKALGQADPTKMFDEFESGLTDVKFVGDETVDGEQLHKYELTLDPKQLKDSLPTGAAGSLPDTITYLAWIDDADHLRKVTFDLMGTQAEMTMSKYGEPVDVKAPPASEVVKAPAGM